MTPDDDSGAKESPTLSTTAFLWSNLLTTLLERSAYKIVGAVRQIEPPLVFFENETWWRRADDEKDFLLARSQREWC